MFGTTLEQGLRDIPVNMAKRPHVETMKSRHIFENAVVLRGHINTVATLALWNSILPYQFIFCGFITLDTLYSGSIDCTIRGWDIEGNCKLEIDGTVEIVSLEEFNDHLCAGSTDDAIMMFDSFGKLFKILKGHTDVVWCLKKFNGCLYSGSADETVRVWDIEGNCIAVLEDHTDAIKCLKDWRGYMYSGSRDCTIRIWDKSHKSVATLEGHTQCVLCMEVFRDKLFSGSIDQTIRGWDENGRCQMILRGHTQAVVCLQVLYNALYSGSYDFTIRAWDKNGNCIEVLNCHTEVWCLVAYNNFLCSGSSDATIRCWDKGPKSLFNICLKVICERYALFESVVSKLPKDLYDEITICVRSHVNNSNGHGDNKLALPYEEESTIK